MTRSKLIGRSLNISLGEPWELVAELAKSIHLGKIVDHGFKSEASGVEYLIIKIDASFEHNGVHYEYFLATPYHGDLTFKVLLLWFGFDCSLQVISKQIAESKKPFSSIDEVNDTPFIANIELDRNSAH